MKRYAYLLMLTSCGGFLCSCAATAQQNLNLIFSPYALDNAIRIPYSNVAPLAELVARYLQGR